MNRSFLLAAALSVASTCLGQTYTTVPAVYDTTEAPDVTLVVAAGIPARQQILIDGVHLSQLVGHSITGIQFRRDSTLGDGLLGGSSDLIVRIGISPGPAADAVADFGVNVSGATDVFRGTLTVPSTPSGSGFAGWQASHVVGIPFSVPYTYGGGTLCIDLESTTSGSGLIWPVDALRDSTTGFVVDLGGQCGPLASTGSTAGTHAELLIPGSTARFWFRNEPGSFAVMLLGLPPTGTPLDLGFAGAPGCSLAVSPMIEVPAVVPAQESFPGFGGVAYVVVDLPAQPGLLGAAFGVQWAGVGSQLVTSNALDCQLAPSVPTIGVAIVEQRNGDPAPEVNLTTAPVLRFESY